MLTPEHIARLRQPFTPEAVKWRADAKKPDAQGRVRCLPYLDSSLARERLSEVDPEWTATPPQFLAGGPGEPIGLTAYAPTLMGLTVHGIQRWGIGQIGTKQADSKHAKSAVSDAFKRAALEFGIGAYLRALPVFYATGDGSGYWAIDAKDDRTGKPYRKVMGLNPEGVKQLRGQYAKVVGHPKFVERFGEAIDYGDVADDHRSAVVDALFDAEDAVGARTAPAGRKVARGKA